MKIAIFTDTFLPQVNGVSNTLDRLARHLDKNDFPYMIFAPRCETAPQYDYSLHTSHAIDLPFYQEHKIALPNYNEISGFLSDFKPDLIHLVTPFSMGLCGQKYARSQGIPIVASFHTNFPQYLGYYKAVFLTHWAWQYLKWFHQFSLKNYCPSDTTIKMLHKHGFKNLEKWGRGIDTNLYDPGRADNNFKEALGLQDKTILLYVGRLAPEKDLDILLDAFKIISRKNPSVHLVMAGDGPLLEKLKSTLPPGITLTGYLHGEELARAYASSDIFIFPSTTETYGNVILEAMASGLPVVASPSGGIKENLVHQYNGLSCRPRNAGDFANAVLKLTSDEGLRHNISKQARKYTLTRSWDSVFEKLINSYHEVIKRSKQKLA